MGIANRFIPPLPERVMGETMLTEVAMDSTVLLTVTAYLTITFQ